MNHRQWKKNFKKQHGRNPYFWEDKKKRSKFITNVINIDFGEIAKRLHKAMENAIGVISDYGHTLAEAAETLINLLDTEHKENEKHDD